MKESKQHVNVTLKPSIKEKAKEIARQKKLLDQRDTPSMSQLFEMLVLEAWEQLEHKQQAILVLNSTAEEVYQYAESLGFGTDEVILSGLEALKEK